MNKIVEAAAKAIFDFANGYSMDRAWEMASHETKGWYYAEARAAITAAIDAITDDYATEIMQRVRFRALSGTSHGEELRVALKSLLEADDA